MRWETLVLGIAVLGFGVFLVSSHGYLGSTYLPGLIGLPAPNSTNASTPSPFSSFGGYSIGTIVAISGLGMIGAGLRTPSRTHMAGNMAGMNPGMMAAMMGGGGQAAASAPALSPELIAAMMMARQQVVAAAGSVPASAVPRSCPSCNAPNSADAVFCQKCATRLAPATPTPTLAPPKST